MSTEKRITPQEVVDAYRKTGSKPVLSMWVDGTTGCCGMMAVYQACKPPFGVAGWAVQVYGEEYYYGFLSGFDGNDGRHSTARYKQGHEDGKAAAKAVGL